MPGLLRRNDPDFIAPLISEEIHKYAPDNPFWQHAEGQGFIAYRGAMPVGRIMAHIDRLDRERHGPERGHFGALAATDATVLRALLVAAEDWLTARDTTHILGPLTRSTNEEPGLLIEGAHRPAMLLMNQGPAWMAEALEAQGYSRAKDLLAFFHDAREEMSRPAAAMAARAEKEAGLTLRPLSMARLEEDIDLVVAIFNSAWAENWGFVPMTEAEIAAMAKSLKPIIRPDWVLFAEVQGKPVGMILALPNLNEAIAGLKGRLLPFGWARLLWRLKIGGVRGARVLMMGLDPSLQSSPLGSGIAFLLIRRLWDNMIRDGVTHAELSWILEDNTPMCRMIEAAGARVDKRYRVYEKHVS